MNSVEGIIAIGPEQIVALPKDLEAGLRAHRVEVEATLARYLAAGSADLSECQLRVLNAAEFCRATHGLAAVSIGRSRPTARHAEFITETIHSMSLSNEQIPELVDAFLDFWANPRGYYVLHRSFAIDGLRYQAVSAMLPDNEEPDDAPQSTLLDVVMCSGLGGIAGLI